MYRINFYCPEIQDNVLMQCQVQETEIISIQIATPKVCSKLAKFGCLFQEGDGCLLDKEVQGNYKLTEEVRL